MSSGMINNVYTKPSGKKVTVPSRIVNSKATKASETTLGKAQDTGRARGPLRGVARRSRSGMAEMTDAQIKAKYPSQSNAKSTGNKARARTAGKVIYSELIPAKTVPIKVRNTGGLRLGGPMGGGGAFGKIK